MNPGDAARRTRHQADLLTVKPPEMGGLEDVPKIQVIVVKSLDGAGVVIQQFQRPVESLEGRGGRRAADVVNHGAETERVNHEREEGVEHGFLKGEALGPGAGWIVFSHAGPRQATAERLGKQG